MNLWNWLRNILKRGKKVSPPDYTEVYEGTIQIGHLAITRPLHQIAEQEQRSPEDVANEFLSHGIEKYEHFDEKLVKWNTLSGREQQILALSRLGYTTQDIAQKLFISPNTVKTHFRNVEKKFNVQNKEQLKQLFQGWDFSEFDR